MVTIDTMDMDSVKKGGEYDQEIPQSHITDQPMVLES